MQVSQLACFLSGGRKFSQWVVAAVTGTNIPLPPALDLPTPATNSMILNFTPPQTTVDGSPLTGNNALTTYDVYYGTNETTVNQGGGTLFGTHPAAGAITVTVTGLSSATTYYFGICANNAYGQSSLSGVNFGTTP